MTTALLETYRAALLAEEPAVLEHRLSEPKKNALHYLQDQGFPGPKHDMWKYVNLDTLMSQSWPFQPPRPESLSPELIARTSEVSGISVRFFNQFSLEMCSWNTYPGITFESVDDLSEQSMRQLLTILGQTESYPSNPFRAANLVAVSDITVLRIREKTVVPEPVYISQILASVPESIWLHRRILVIIEPEAQVELVWDIVNELSTASGFNGVFDIQVQDRAKAALVISHEAAGSAHHLVASHIILGAKSEFKASILAHSGALVHTDLHVVFEAPDAVCELNGLSILTGETRVHHVVGLHHKAGQCASDQLFKSILAGKTRYEYTGIVNVAPHAQKTVSGQLNRNLVLSDEAIAYARPWLSINADDVKCNHGSSTGQLDADEIFYLMSRGLSETDSRTLLAYGFAEQMLSRLAVPTCWPVMEKIAIQALQAVSAPPGSLQ